MKEKYIIADVWYNNNTNENTENLMHWWFLEYLFKPMKLELSKNIKKQCFPRNYW